jgi:hypothetical protein
LDNNFTRAVENLYAEKILSRTNARNRNKSPEKQLKGKNKFNPKQAGPSTSAKGKGQQTGQQQKRVPNKGQQKGNKGKNPWNNNKNKPAKKRQDLMTQLLALTKAVKGMTD